MGGYIFTLRSDGGNAQSISLAAGKNIDVSGTADVVIGSSVANERLSIDLGMSAHAFSVAAGRTLTVLNTINGSGAMSKQGTGALKLATPNALPTTTTLSLAGTTLLDLLASQMVTGFSDSVGSLITIESGQEFAVTLGDAVAGTTFEGAIEGLGAFRVGANNGDGQVVTLTQDNTFMGGTTIDAGGALQLGNGGSTGLVAGNVVDYGRLVFDHPSPIMYGAVISGTGRLQQGLAGSSGVAGDLRLTGANTYSGGTETYDGAVIAASASGSATGGGPVTVHAGAMLLGKGTITSPVVVKPGGMLGAAVDATAPSSFTVGATTLYSGGEFGFVIRDANGVAGTDLSLCTSAAHSRCRPPRPIRSSSACIPPPAVRSDQRPISIRRRPTPGNW